MVEKLRHIKWIKNGREVDAYQMNKKWGRSWWISNEQEIDEKLMNIKWIRNVGEVGAYQMCKKLLKSWCMSDE